MIIKNSHIGRYFKMFKINSYLNIFYFIVKLYVQEKKNKRLKIIKLKKIKIKNMATIFVSVQCTCIFLSF